MRTSIACLFIILCVAAVSVHCFTAEPDLLLNESDSQRFQDANESVRSLFVNYYCGSVDGFPHFRQTYSSDCYSKNSTHISDREFWTDGNTPNALIYLYTYMGSNVTSDMRSMMQSILSDWNFNRIRKMLLWDKLGLEDRYGVWNDDRLWYAIAFIRLAKISTVLSQQIQFRQLAKEIYQYMDETQQDNLCGGGFYWNPHRDMKNIITTHLFLDLAIYLYQDSNQQSYLDTAIRLAEWEISSTLYDKNNRMFSDGLDGRNCKDIHYEKWSYNQAVHFRAYLELTAITGNPKYEMYVREAIYAVILNFNPPQEQFLQYYPFSSTQTVILREFKDERYDESNANFKGIYMRYIGDAYVYYQKIQDKTMINLIENYVSNNANFIRPIKDRNGSYPYSWVRNQPKDQQRISSSTQTSAVDLFTLYGYIRMIKDNNLKASASE